MKTLKNSKMLLFFLGLFGFMSSANALLYVEPYAGYRLSTQTNTVAGVEYEYGQDGVALGARLGTSLIPLITVGLQYEMGSFAESNEAGTGLTLGDNGDEYDTTYMGAFAAFTSLPLINVWASYFFSAEDEITKSNTAASVGNVYSGSGYGVGAGFTGLPFLSINLDYRMFTFDELESSGTTTTLTNEFDTTQIMLSVSSPWDF